MPRYRVTVRSTVYEYRILEVEAEDDLSRTIDAAVSNALYDAGPTPPHDSIDTGDDDVLECVEIKQPE